ncbi:MAG: cyclic nucleotide-binding domain-containing protein [Fibrobacteria bacterium]|nr:cyclic nucleotide-binding domain-containing protein [Fibrobacteria bacterium]
MPELHEDPIPRHPWLAQLGQAYPAQIQRFRYQDSEEVLHEGDIGDAIYFLEEGSLVVEQSVGDRGARHVLKILSNRDGGQHLIPFGEMSHLLGGRRSATIRSSGGSIVVRLDSTTFEPIYRDFPDLARTLNLKLVERLNDSNARLKELAMRLEPPVDRVFADSARILVHKGEVPDALWQCVAGTLLSVDHNGARRDINPDPDGFFDADCFFKGTPSPRTIEASPGSFLVRWDGRAPSEVFRFHPELALRLLRNEA